MSPIVLITGCSSGFGLVTAAHLTEKGYQVVATMRNLEKKSALISEFNKRNLPLCDIRQLDVTDASSIRECFKTIGETHGYLDVLINNAGFGLGGFFEDLSPQQIRAQMDTNFFGVMDVTRAAISLMRHREGAKIINISSVSGFSTSPFFTAYCSSKWALEGFSEALRYELKPFGIDVLLIEPGTYLTKIFFDNAQRAVNMNNADSPYFSRSQFIEKRIHDHAANCRKDPEDVAKLIEKLIRAKNPAFRNIPDGGTKFLWRLRKILPFRIYSWIVTKAVFHGYTPERN